MKKKLSNKIQDPLLDNKLGFFEKVFEVARKVPYGRVTSYGSIAKFLGTAKSARMVGWAMNQTHGLKDIVPAHRVVNRMGLLTGKHHFATENEMENLLKSEGIKVVNDKIIDFNKYFWDPCKELI
jgi:methylated-DNA-protein-cysteine methyltransferase-like protein